MNIKAKILFRVTVFLILPLCSVAITSYAITDNLLKNPGFEDGYNDWYDWVEDDMEMNNIGEISTKFSHTENYSACREILGKGKGCFGQVIKIFPGETIQASVWIMSPESEPLSNGAEAYLRIEFWDNKAPLLYGVRLESIRFNKSCDWTKVEVKGTAPKDSAEARILAFTRGKNSSSKGKVYFDDFEATIASRLF